MSELHRHTPTLAVFNPLGQPVRAVVYHQHPDPKHVADTPTRVTANETLHCGRISKSWDPRLFAEKAAGKEVSPNLTNQHSLSGRLLFADSVDAGWRLTLWGALGQPLLSWDGRGTRQRHRYDDMQRPCEVFEHSATETEERCSSRINYVDEPQNPNFFTRNLCGQPIQVYDGAGSLRFNGYSLHGASFNETRQFLQESDEPDWSNEVPLETGLGATTFRRYNALGELLSQTDAAGNTQSSDYDVAGRLRTSALQLVGKQPQVLVSAIQYNAFGQIETETTGNGVVNESIYCPKTGRLLRLSAKRPSDNDSNCLQDLNYAYDPVGNILSVEDKSRPVQHCANQCIEPLRTFAYDSLDQLVVASGWEVRKPNRGPALPAYQGPCLDASQLANYHETYAYDAAGNLQELKHVGAHNFTRRLTTAKGSNRSLLEPNKNNENNNRLLTETDLAEAFDENGNLKKLQPGRQTLQWDSHNQLRQVTPVRRDNGLNDSETYLYANDGQRVRKVSRRQASGAELVSDVRYLPGLEIRTNSATGEVLHVINAPAGRSSARVLDWKQAPSNDLQNQQLRYSLDDHLGSSTLELDDQAQVLSQEGYYPYGGTAWWAASNQTEAKYKTIRYSGKERDATGLYYYGFRYYAPWLGRWINPDPAGTSDGLNLFRMVKNNPIKHKDVSGLIGEEINNQNVDEEEQSVNPGVIAPTIPTAALKPKEPPRLTGLHTSRGPSWGERVLRRFSNSTKTHPTILSGLIGSLSALAIIGAVVSASFIGPVFVMAASFGLALAGISLLIGGTITKFLDSHFKRMGEADKVDDAGWAVFSVEKIVDESKDFFKPNKTHYYTMTARAMHMDNLLAGVAERVKGLDNNYMHNVKLSIRSLNLAKRIADIDKEIKEDIEDDFTKDRKATKAALQNIVKSLETIGYAVDNKSTKNMRKAAQRVEERHRNDFVRDTAM